MTNATTNNSPANTTDTSIERVSALKSLRSLMPHRVLSYAEALQRAQIEMLRSEKYQQPYYWAAFVPIGGYTKF